MVVVMMTTTTMIVVVVIVMMMTTTMLMTMTVMAMMLMIVSLKGYLKTMLSRPSWGTHLQFAAQSTWRRRKPGGKWLYQTLLFQQLIVNLIKLKTLRLNFNIIIIILLLLNNNIIISSFVVVFIVTTLSTLLLLDDSETRSSARIKGAWPARSRDTPREREALCSTSDRLTRQHKDFLVYDRFFPVLVVVVVVVLLMSCRRHRHHDHDHHHQHHRHHHHHHHYHLQKW